MPMSHRSAYVSSIFFFFQAEDGIRDLTVTGVQTCALPIYPLADGLLVLRPRPAEDFDLAGSRVEEPLGDFHRGRLAGPVGDRKSTRLNSSHSQISYAVFCLKKKKHNASLNMRHNISVTKLP